MFPDSSSDSVASCFINVINLPSLAHITLKPLKFNPYDMIAVNGVEFDLNQNQKLMTQATEAGRLNVTLISKSKSLISPRFIIHYSSKHTYTVIKCSISILG